MTTDSSIATHDAASRLATIQDDIARAARLTGRTADAVTLIAISKTKDADAIRPLIAAGQRVFGENRVQEAQEKWPALRQAHPDISLHLVGQLQSNKAADAVALFDVIHSLDRPSLLTALAKAMDAAGKRVPCYIQVNIGAEPQKGGCAIADTPALIAAARAADIPLLGLMAVPPADVEPAPYFALLAKMAREEGLPRLSMGMSSDYETAIMLGATDIRVGTALFGDRPPPARPVPRSGLGMLRNSPGA
ncbi:YggS family pyridoxal phosphate-dependent enzyme [Sphingobium terrigena]|uniref:Pyridoxal phosphate homeostasis protein n=1 Tax=Sphingobium terrigena TaxID=2304063 RepID=A0A418YY30_9SPHN|nr:YggS family pyridoxal phosphate-dependent enzyme [Sphingobium terrigena]RJG57777.1 YggS family pyridoxal phosphate-dependent enzyme [Sphingobium terrigena]